MKLTELEHILNHNNFQDSMEKYVTNEITKKKDYLNEYNPFKPEEISKKLILTTIIQCTVILASLIYLLHKKEVNT